MPTCWKTSGLALNVFTHARSVARPPPGGREDLEVREVETQGSRQATTRACARARPGIDGDQLILHLDVIRDLKRINGHLTSVAYPILEAAGELADTRLKTAQPLIREPLES